MKALTLTQPWATLVAIGAKKIETRSWSTIYRGLLAIHAARGFPAGCRELVNDPYDIDLCKPFVAALRPHGYTSSTQLPLGAIVAVCALIECVPTQHPGVANEPGKPWFTGARAGVGQHYYEVPPPIDSNEYAFGDYTPGRYAWLLADVKMLAEPIPCRGALGLWEYDVLTQMAIKREEGES